VKLEKFNVLPNSDAEHLLRQCCGSSRWVDAMMARRPFASHDMLHHAADESWDGCGKDDWLEAFSHHPRIGDKSAAGAASEEQSGMRTASSALEDEMARLNRAYEERFGHIYIVCATGKSASELRDIARHRIDNDPHAELHNAAGEQRKIMHLRLEKIFGDES
jgi:OHCU decarboxylase